MNIIQLNLIWSLVVNGDGINVRSGSGLEHHIVRKASNGDRYKVLAVKMVGIK